MIHAIEIQKFRGIPYLKLENIAPVNIFTGLNGAGKTSVLEAIHIACNGNSPIHLPMLAQIRGQGINPNTDIALRSYFTYLDLHQPPQITLRTEDGDYELALAIPEKAATRIIHAPNGVNGVASVLSSGGFYDDRISELIFRCFPDS